MANGRRGGFSRPVSGCSRPGAGPGVPEEAIGIVPAMRNPGTPRCVSVTDTWATELPPGGWRALSRERATSYRGLVLLYQPNRPRGSGSVLGTAVLTDCHKDLGCCAPWGEPGAVHWRLERLRPVEWTWVSEGSDATIWLPSPQLLAEVLHPYAPPVEPTALYRCFDAAGTLLYVGVTGDPAARWSHHRSTKAWWPQVETKHVAWFGYRGLAEEAERCAIRTELPRYNIAGHPERQAERADREVLARLDWSVRRIRLAAAGRNPPSVDWPVRGNGSLKQRWLG